jgi:hypothetical protein
MGWGGFEKQTLNLGKSKDCKTPALPALRHCLKKCLKLSWEIYYNQFLHDNLRQIL